MRLYCFAPAKDFDQLAAIALLAIVCLNRGWGSMCRSGPAFEVATVKAHPDPSAPVRFKLIESRRTWNRPADTLRVPWMPAGAADRQSLRSRYDLQVSGGPDWPRSDHMFEVNAKVPEGDAVRITEQFQQMLQSLLAERFRLRTVAKRLARSASAMSFPLVITKKRRIEIERRRSSRCADTRHARSQR